MKLLDFDADIIVELRRLSNQIITCYGACDFTNYTNYVFKILFENDFSHTLESYHFRSLTFDWLLIVGAFRC